MAPTIRDLTISDQPEVNSLCDTIWGGNDYVPQRFPEWIEEQDSYASGMFVDGRLVALGALEVIPESKLGWIKGLRVHEDYRNQGYGMEITRYLVDIAKAKKVDALWYATSSRNVASQKLAETLGFRLSNTTGYFRLEPPYPPHPKPSQSIHPMKVDELRLTEMLDVDESFIESSTFPVAWEFYRKDLPSLARLSREAKIRVVTDDNGRINTLYIMAVRRRADAKTLTFTIYSSNRTVFVDVFSRIIDELVEERADRAAFFLGPRVEQWVNFIVDIPEEFVGRRFLLYEKELQKNQE